MDIISASFIGHIDESLCVIQCKSLNAEEPFLVIAVTPDDITNETKLKKAPFDTNPRNVFPWNATMNTLKYAHVLNEDDPFEI